MDKAAYELSEVTTDGTHPAVGNDPYPNLNAKAIENAAFTVVKGPRGYDQRQVDYYLATCADLLGRLESYQRLNENGSIPASGTVERPASAAPVNGVKPLFANVPQTQGDEPENPATSPSIAADGSCSGGGDFQRRHRCPIAGDSAGHHQPDACRAGRGSCLAVLRGLRANRDDCPGGGGSRHAIRKHIGSGNA